MTAQRAAGRAPSARATYDPDKADKLRKDENKKYKKPLKVKINPSKNPADFGDIVDLDGRGDARAAAATRTTGAAAPRTRRIRRRRS